MPAAATASSTEQAQRQAGANYARQTVEKMFASSQIHDNSHDFPQFTLQELDMGKLLGKGGFGSVFEIRGFGSSGGAANKTAGNSSNQTESRDFIAAHCLRDNGDARYAVKILSKETVADTGLFIKGMTDMAVETRVLSDIEHTNIVKMRAIAQSDAFSADYFIVMDRLYDTLESRIGNKWSKTMKRCTGMGRRFTDPKGLKLADLYEDRLVAAFDLAAAVEYLHNRQILYRDIKPENIGFDIRDDVKIFDFGLAKELHAHQRNADGTYNLTEMTGSMIYMAPEVANGQPYHASCDVYSFAVLLWEIMALQPPYQLYTPRTLREKVYNGPHKRPLIPDQWSPAIKICLKRSWAADLQARNSMANITEILRKECIRARNGDESGLSHDQRRSTFIFRGANRHVPSPVKKEKSKVGGAVSSKGGLAEHAAVSDVPSENRSPQLPSVPNLVETQVSVGEECEC